MILGWLKCQFLSCSYVSNLWSIGSTNSLKHIGPNNHHDEDAAFDILLLQKPSVVQIDNSLMCQAKASLRVKWQVHTSLHHVRMGQGGEIDMTSSKCQICEQFFPNLKIVIKKFSTVSNVKSSKISGQVAKIQLILKAAGLVWIFANDLCMLVWIIIKFWT